MLSSHPLVVVIADYLDASQQGRPLDRSALIAQHPNIAHSLVAFFQDHDRMLKAGNLPPSESTVSFRLIEPLAENELATQALGIDATQGIRRDGRYFGGYELLNEISRGGMGIVYRARQVKLNRIVALKMILSGALACEEEVLRFKSEAAAAAKLDHPGIVPIYEIGECNGQHYYSMGFVDGQSLAVKLHHGPMPPNEAAALIVKIATAVGYANLHGVIHRDLKPANILIDSSGHPRVTDFGVAKLLEGSSDLTRSGQVLGTPGYMPPEQAACRLNEIGATSDVYSLGAILYATLTCRAPFAAANPIDTLMQVLEGEATLPSKAQPGIPRALDSICMKCLEKSPAARYKTAEELAMDLRRFLQNEPLAARPTDVAQRIRRWCRREPALVVHLAGLAAMTTIVQITYIFIGTDEAYHVALTSVLLLWSATVFGLQKLFNLPHWNAAAASAWCVIDTLFMTMVLYLAEPPIGPLLSGYGLLIAACGFLLKEHLVAITTGTSILCYFALLPLKPELTIRPHYCVMFVMLLLILGSVIAAQVRRISRLNRHFENQ